MAVRNIFFEGDPILRKKAKEVTVFDERLGVLLDDMFETMRVNGGVGLAGPQVGILKRVAVIEYGDDKLELVNPKILSQSGSVIGFEGCLSVDHKKDGKVIRPQELTLAYQDRHGARHERKAEGWLARIVCHELDHLDGILFIDKVIKDEKEGE